MSEVRSVDDGNVVGPEDRTKIEIDNDCVENCVQGREVEDNGNGIEGSVEYDISDDMDNVGLFNAGNSDGSDSDIDLDDGDEACFFGPEDGDNSVYGDGDGNSAIINVDIVDFVHGWWMMRKIMAMRLRVVLVV